MSDIFKAIQDGDLEQVKTLAPAEGAARNEDGVSALMLARYYGRLDMVDAIRPHAGEPDVFEAAILGESRVRSADDSNSGRNDPQNTHCPSPRLATPTVRLSLVLN